MIVQPNLQPGLGIKEIAAIIFGQQFDTNKAVLDFCRPASDRLLAKWSATQDLGIYSSPDYIQECVLSYFLVSKEVTRGIGRWVQYFEVQPQNCTFFELYPGIGINTLFLSALGFDCYVHTGNAAQLAVSEKLHRHFGLKQPTVLSDTEWRSRQFDFVGAFEVLEHFDEPKEVATALATAVKSTGLLFESTGFSPAPYPGHWAQYNYNGEILPPGRVLKAIHKDWRESGLSLIYSSFNDKPRVWAKDGRPAIPKNLPDGKRNYIGAQNFQLHLG